jgi:hypothetical protein
MQRLLLMITALVPADLMNIAVPKSILCNPYVRCYQTVLLFGVRLRKDYPVVYWGRGGASSFEIFHDLWDLHY